MQIMSMENFDVNPVAIIDRSEIDRYLKEIRKIKQISPEEEARLAKLIKQGDQKSLDKLIKANLRFVVSVAQQYQGNGLPMADLINEGNDGLTEAAKRFDETKNVKFISYAVQWIRKSILAALTNKVRMIRLPENKVADLKKVKEFIRGFEQKHQREPSAEEIAKLLEMKEEDVSTVLSIGIRPVSLDSPFPGNQEGTEDSTLLSVIRDTNTAETDSDLVYNESLKRELERSLKTLATEEQEVLYLYFGLGGDPNNPPFPITDFNDIDVKLKLEKGKAQRLYKSALKKMKTTKRSDRLKPFLNPTLKSTEED